MRKWFTCLFAGLWLFAMQSASAQCSFTGFGLKIENITATQGQQVCLDVSTQNFTNILGMQFTIQYNQAALQFNNVASLNLNGLSAASFGTPQPGRITMTWNDPDVVGITRPDGTVIFELCFTVIANTTSMVSFTNTPTSIEILDNNLNEITFHSCPGTVTVGGGGGGGTLGLSIENATAAQGQQVCLNVATQGFNDIAHMQFSIQYNSSVLQFVNATNMNLNGLSAASFANPSAGVITMTWNDPATTGITLPNGTVIFELCFTITGTTTSTVSFTNTPTDIEILNGDAQELTLNGTSGTVTVSGGGSGGNCNITGFGLEIEDANGTQGQQICLEVRTHGFNDILGMQYSINYNASVLQFVNASSFNLNGLAAASFGNPSAGTITMTWNDPDVAGITLPNGTVIYELCFNVTGNTTTDITFGNTPTAIEILDGDLDELTFNSCPGTVTLSGGGGPQPTTCNITGFGLEIEDANGTQGQQICLEVRTHGFTDILGMQYSINYNASVLQFVNASSFNLNGLAAASFGNPSAGTITMTWNDPDVAGITLPNGTVIYELCFNVTGNTTTDITFGNTPTAIEILDGDLDELTFNSCSGTVTLGGGGGPNPEPCNITGFGLEIEDVTATQGQQVCVEVRTHGFNDILGMQYSINYNASVLQFVNASSFNLNGLAAASFGNPSAGTITMTWNDPDVAGITLPNGTVIYELCFNVTGNTTSTITFGNTPTAIEILDGDLDELTFNSCSGTVTVGDIVDPPTESCTTISGFGLEIEDHTATAAGQSFCLEVRTHAFTDIIGMQYTINYNPAILQYTGPSALNLPDLTATGSFGTPSPGTITLTWNDNSLNGVTLPDGTVIYELCFTLLSCNTSNVVFGNTPTAIEIINENLIEIPFSSCMGVVSCGAPAEDTVTLNAPTITNVACRGQSTGAITVHATSSTGGTLTYAWSPAGLGTAATISNRPAGTYTVTVTSSNGGTATQTYMITQPTTAVTINSVTVNDVTCNGLNNGSILVSASGGTGTLSYAWTAPPPLPGNTPNPTNLIPFDFYRVTVTDASGCTAVSMLLDLNEPAALAVAAGTIQNVLCGGASTGSIAVNVTGGTSPYTYNWSGSAPDTNPTTGLAAGTYSLTVTDARNCTQTLTNVNVVNLNPPVAIVNAAVTDITDGSPGSVNITVQGGNNTYTYNWNGPGNFTATTQDISGLTTGGQYCVTVTDGNGCTATTCATLGEDLNISAFSINKACSGTSTGGVDITVEGGTPPYTYVWRNSSNVIVPGTPQDLVNVPAGTYNVTVSDAASNQVTGSFEVTSLPAINVAANIGSASNGNNGSITLNITGGAAPYNVTWSTVPPQTGASISNLAAGQYCATVTDANLCTFTSCYMVTSQPFAFGAVIATDVSCNGVEDGTLSVTVLGGSAPYTLTIDGTPYTSNNGTFVITDLGASNWSFTVTDNAGATLNNTAEITEPSAITAQVIVIHDTEDPGCTGSITLNITGGTPGYQVQWNGAGSSPQIISLCENSYIPTITDANDCVVTLPAIALNTFSETGAPTNVACPNDEDGIVDLTITGGNLPYTFEWKNSDGEVVSDEEDLTNVPAGEYTVRITDNSGLVLVRHYTIVAESSFSVTAQVTSNFAGFAVSCADGANGAAVANITGQGDFDVVWENAEGTTFVGSTLQNAAPGIYTATVTDELGCEVTAEVTLNAPSPITLNANVTPVSCIGEKNAEIQVFAAGGIPGNYQYQWSTGTFGNLVRFLGTGDYSVTTTDLNGCEMVTTYTIAEPTPITVEFEVEPATEGFNGTILAIVNGGQTPYQYNWINLNASPLASLVSSLAPGEYFLVVTDDNGCQSDTLVAQIGDERYPCLEERIVITPDGNGQNDEFIIFCIGDLPNNNLEIYNRWGQLVFETENYDNTWAGTSQNGNPLPDGPYYYVLEYVNPDGATVQAKGSLTIVRE